MRYNDFRQVVGTAKNILKNQGRDVDTGRWQGIPTEGKPDLVTREVLNYSIEVPLHRKDSTTNLHWLDIMAAEIGPNRAWADEHFLERIGGVPNNPDPSHVRWPHWQGQDSTTKVDGEFSHTYSERFWPRDAGVSQDGIRFKMGDYEDLCVMLNREPYTRQAYLPIFFPEDTGAVHGGRIPCTLGYHFMLRDDRFHMWYDIRSCDFYRHFRDDLYLAVRLQQYTLLKLRSMLTTTVWRFAALGNLYFNAHSLHLHKGDWHHVYPEG